MIDLDNLDIFTPVEGAEQGVTVYVLTEKAAPVQQGFYFVNSGMTDDARYVWFYCGFPPSPKRSLGLVDLQSGEVNHFPQTQFSGASPYVDTQDGTVFWGVRESVWMLSPETGEPELVNSLPEEVVGTRSVYRLATHLTLSADGTEFLIDAALGVKWIMGSLPVDGGDFELWHRFDRNYNHAQFSPKDPDLVLFAEENHPDPITGLKFPIVNRMWLIRRGGEPEPVFDSATRVTHEWWDRDGEHVWCVWGNESWRTNITTKDVEKISWPAHCWHAHDSAEGEYLVSDSNETFYRGCPSSVYFMNRKTGKYLEIINNPEIKGITGSKYHIDPHPRFCCDGRYIVFTTTVRGEVDLAIVRTQDLITQT